MSQGLIMRNRAKCKLCGDIIESLHRHDYVRCSCDEIAVDGGPGGKDGTGYWRCSAKDWRNFVRVDDDDNEVLPKIVEKDDVTKPNKRELIEMLDEMVKNIENLPPAAMTSYVTQYDLASLMMLLSSIFKASSEDPKESP